MLSYSHLVALAYKFLYVFLKMALMKSYHLLHLPWWDAEVKDLTADVRVLVIDNEPLPPSVEHDLVIILALNLPIALHSWSHLLVVLFWNIERGGVIVWIFWCATLGISNEFRLCEPWTILNLLNELGDVSLDLSEPCNS